MNAVARPALLAPDFRASSQGVVGKLAAAKYHLIALVVVALVASVAMVGYPLVISLALFATFSGLSMLIGLTLIDLLGRPTRKRAALAARRRA